MVHVHVASIEITQFSQILDSVRRKHFQFEHPNQPSNQPGPSHQTSTSTCPVCDVRLPVDQEAASSHVASCLAEAEESGDSENGYEEYTWGDETRVRATSLLSHRERASEGIVAKGMCVVTFIASLC